MVVKGSDWGKGGGWNLYGFVGNHAIGETDLLGRNGGPYAIGMKRDGGASLPPRWWEKIWVFGDICEAFRQALEALEAGDEYAREQQIEIEDLQGPNAEKELDEAYESENEFAKEVGEAAVSGSRVSGTTPAGPASRPNR